MGVWIIRLSFGGATACCCIQETSIVGHINGTFATCRTPRLITLSQCRHRLEATAAVFRQSPQGLMEQRP